MSGLPDQTLENFLVTEVNAVKISDGDSRRPGEGDTLLKPSDYVHRVRA